MHLPLPDDRCLRLRADISKASGLLLWLAMSLIMGPPVGCASLGSSDDGGGAGGAGPSSKIVTVACGNSITEVASLLGWELTVSRETPIKSGEPFFVRLDGIVVFNESFLDEAQPLVPGGVREANLVDLNATVHVRSGATGDDDVILKIEPIPYKCFFGRAECNPANDDPQGVPGARGNPECKPEDDLNPCGRFVPLPISTDCDPGGVCAELGKMGQCSDNEFCITGDLRLELDVDFGEYTADSQGNVLFGWAEGESTGATIQEGGHNSGTWNLPPAVPEDPTGPIGVRVGIGTVLVALECTMGVSSGSSLLSRRTPDAALISFPIQTP